LLDLDTPISDRTPKIEEWKFGLALSGGGARAIAFHLGSMKALHELGLLQRVSVLSTVSGGSVIGAMWAYSEYPFDSFEADVRQLLRRGLQRDIVLSLLSPITLAKWIATVIVAHPVNLLTLALRLACGLVALPLKAIGIRSPWVSKIQPPLCRWASRTTALEKALERKVFGQRSLAAERRNGIDIVINSCEARSGTALRFGSRRVANYLLGSISPEKVHISTAVAASAAFPILLPAMDLRLTFEGKGGKRVHRVMLTDGGVYDNLGTSALQRGKDPLISANAFELDYILCSSAGQGRPDELSFPYWFGSRMISTASVQFRRLQDMGLALLHSERAAGCLRGFALSYLGQRDDRIEQKGRDWVPRERVQAYPTNFSAMSEEDTDALITRGYQLMLAVIKQHSPELLPVEADEGAS
jgi:NTE family protein